MYTDADFDLCLEYARKVQEDTLFLRLKYPAEPSANWGGARARGPRKIKNCIENRIMNEGTNNTGLSLQSYEILSCGLNFPKTSSGRKSEW
jgi:hypothetical protein